MGAIVSQHNGIELDLINLSPLSRFQGNDGKNHMNAPEINRQTLVEYIFKEITEEESFLTFSNQMADVNKILKMEYSSANDIAKILKKDIALTAKLLKLVNSSFYGRFVKARVSTVSDAMIILGTKEVKLAATSLKLHELIQSMTKNKALKDMALKGLQRSFIVRRIAKDAGLKNCESLQISAILYNFGEFLVALFVPDIYIKVELLLEKENLEKEKASKSIIGLSYNELGRIIMIKWNLPSMIADAMEPVTSFDVSKNALSEQELHRYICAFSNDICTLRFSKDNGKISQQIINITDRYKAVLGISASRSVELIKTSRDKIARYANLHGVSYLRSFNAR
ncbi:MAG: HDOD domain-containing protein [Desulfobacteraceae bacterium]|nr:HDOD domain-containing protein [Desulfobacteraceae bacterium]